MVTPVHLAWGCHLMVLTKNIAECEFRYHISHYWQDFKIKIYNYKFINYVIHHVIWTNSMSTYMVVMKVKLSWLMGDMTELPQKLISVDEYHSYCNIILCLTIRTWLSFLWYFSENWKQLCWNNSGELFTARLQLAWKIWGELFTTRLLFRSWQGLIGTICKAVAEYGTDWGKHIQITTDPTVDGTVPYSWSPAPIKGQVQCWEKNYIFMWTKTPRTQPFSSDIDSELTQVRNTC